MKRSNSNHHHQNLQMEPSGCYFRVAPPALQSHQKMWGFNSVSEVSGNIISLLWLVFDVGVGFFFCGLGGGLPLPLKFTLFWQLFYCSLPSLCSLVLFICLVLILGHFKSLSHLDH